MTFEDDNNIGYIFGVMVEVCGINLGISIDKFSI